MDRLSPATSGFSGGSVGHFQSVEDNMHELIYLIGLIVVVMFILGLLGLR
jgi:hypothetical protein